jgi:ribosomal protein L30
MASLIKVTLKRSLSKCTARQLGTLTGLGLKHRQQTKYLKDTPQIRGMVIAVQHMLDVERIDGPDSMRLSQRKRAREGAKS